MLCSLNFCSMYARLSRFAQKSATPEVSVFFTFNFRLLTVEMKAQPSDASPIVNENDKPPEISRGLRIGRMQGRG